MHLELVSELHIGKGVSAVDERVIPEEIVRRLKPEIRVIPQGISLRGRERLRLCIEEVVANVLRLRNDSLLHVAPGASVQDLTAHAICNDREKNLQGKRGVS